MTLVAPEPDFIYKPLLAVEELFSHQPPEQRALEPIVRESGSRFLQAAAEQVNLAERSVELSNRGNAGIRGFARLRRWTARRRASRHGITFLASGAPLHIDEALANASAAPSPADRLRGPTRRDMAACHLRAGADGPAARREPGSRRAGACGGHPGVGPPDHVSLGGERGAGKRCFGSWDRGRDRRLCSQRRGTGSLILTPGDRRLGVGGLLALPLIEGPGSPGLPSDEHGFIPIDDHARVLGTEDVYAAGDGSRLPIKQGEIATPAGGRGGRAHRRARRGAGGCPSPFIPFYAESFSPGRSHCTLSAISEAGPARGSATLDCLWWPPHGSSGRCLAAWLGETTPQAKPSPSPPRSMSRSHYRRSGIGSRWRSIPMARPTRLENREVRRLPR